VNAGSWNRDRFPILKIEKAAPALWYPETITTAFVRMYAPGLPVRRPERKRVRIRGIQKRRVSGH
jgi:hypothetical protein